MASLTREEKRIQTLIERYGSVEDFNKLRYGNPKAKADLKRAQKLAGQNSLNRPYTDKDKAREAQTKSVEARRAKK